MGHAYQVSTAMPYVGLKLRIAPTNRDKYFLVDLARRQFDHIGRDGIMAKSRQSDTRYARITDNKRGDAMSLSALPQLIKAKLSIPLSVH
jgi:hypothetical protein